VIESQAVQRLRLAVQGAVQGVGFRPFVYRLADEMGVTGWVANGPQGVTMEAEAAINVLREFADRMRAEAPPQAAIHGIESTFVPPVGDHEFVIRSSSAIGERTAVVLPDIATCDDCRRQLHDAADRRAGYAFINCTNCGPRFSIITVLPYDRPNTTMQQFVMCAACAAEYNNPADRRFHAQPNACPECGPAVSIWTANGEPMHVDDPIAAGARALRNGLIVAVKGVGGFHLMVNACDGTAVNRLRLLKRRGTKPFAVMVPNAESAAEWCEMPEVALGLLQSSAAPIVLLRKLPRFALAEGIAPDNPNVGVLVPYSPLHHLLMQELQLPIVATSGNLSEEPICVDEREAVERLRGIADVFLMHNRPIERHVDDSVAFVAAGEPRMLRRARGYAPMPVLLHEGVPNILAVGAHMKNTIAVSKGKQVFISQHIGDLDAAESQQAFERVTRDFLRLYESNPVAIAHDMHPEYASTLFAHRAGLLPQAIRVPVQHHHAHLASCLAENGVATAALGIIWDGTGYGMDGTVWGGEFLLGDASSFERVATLRSFRLPGGDVAAREPRRIAIAMLYEMLGDGAFEAGLPLLTDLPDATASVLNTMLQQGVRSPWTTSAGRLFDGVASILNLRHRSEFEGDAAMALEYAADPGERGAYALPLSTHLDGVLVLDWVAMLDDLIRDQSRGVETAVMAARVHNALVNGLVEVARTVGQPRVALSGGCFQNRRLLEHSARALVHDGFEVLMHRQVPPNDGGISLGQIAVAAARRSRN
jgi:hydrogenase maturation protein HypF